MREAGLWKWLSRARVQYKYGLHMNRIENLIGSGMPDVEGCLNGVQFWIELKVCVRPSKPGTKLKVKFRPAQAPWMNRRIKAGGKAFVLLQVGSGRTASRYLLPGVLAGALAGGLTEERLAELAVAPGDSTADYLIQTVARYEI